MAKTSLLLVDDEEEFVTTLVERLRWRGFRAEAAFSGPAALERLRQAPFDLAVVDLKMPGIDGLELRSLIEDEFPDVTVWLATGHGHDPSRQDEPDPSGQDILLKPFNIDVLIDRINQHETERGRT